MWETLVVMAIVLVALVAGHRGRARVVKGEAILRINALARVLVWSLTLALPLYFLFSLMAGGHPDEVPGLLTCMVVFVPIGAVVVWLVEGTWVHLRASGMTYKLAWGRRFEILWDRVESYSDTLGRVELTLDDGKRIELPGFLAGRRYLSEVLEKNVGTREPPA